MLSIGFEQDGAAGIASRPQHGTRGPPAAVTRKEMKPMKFDQRWIQRAEVVILVVVGLVVLVGYVVSRLR
jgi:hypothetical protein